VLEGCVDCMLSRTKELHEHVTVKGKSNVTGYLFEFN
jgi:hypothetical protein